MVGRSWCSGQPDASKGKVILVISTTGMTAQACSNFAAGSIPAFPTCTGKLNTSIRQYLSGTLDLGVLRETAYLCH